MAFNPVVNFQDILNAINDCGITGFTLEPVGTISLNDPQVLLSLKQVYYIIHPNGMVTDCETDFAAWFNRVTETSYYYEELFDMYNSICGNNAGYICTSPGESEDEAKFAVQLIAQPIGPIIMGNLPPLLCGLNEPSNGPVIVPNDDPCKDLTKIALNSALEKYELYVDSLRNVFDLAYRNKCLAAKNLESFTVKYKRNEYHYTLYYYDQAGNLVKTVPPAGVDAKHSNPEGFLGLVKAARLRVKNGESESLATNIKTPAHTLVTEYRYNTLNQVVAQKTPDAGISKFNYDRLGRLVVSQNAKQLLLDKYSYTLQDELGRIKEVGELTSTMPISQAITQNAGDINTVGSLAWWLNNKPAEQITRTFYDISYFDGTDILCPQYICQQNLRNRVSFTAIYPTGTPGNAAIVGHTAATYYSYDIHGNVFELLQDFNSGYMKYKNPNLTGLALDEPDNASGNRFKKLAYEYDLISGKVNSVTYQPDYYDAATSQWKKPSDQFNHRYSYDAENRLTDVETSSDQLFWQKDARYSYYKHGPLARTILGQNQVQGIEYAYTLQGWLKGVNSTSLQAGEYDMGGDGFIGGANSNIARDVFGYSLNYFSGDYKPIGGTSANPFTGGTFGLTNTGNEKVANELFNGNIAAMFVNIPKLGNAQLYGYKYDQLNRIKSMDAFEGFSNASNSFTSAAQPISAYKETISYDPNGNIKTYLRNGDATRIPMDNMTYTYKPGTNQLDKVADAAANITTGYENYNDIKQFQTNGNYQYDAIGNLISDDSENISNIEWTVYGKIAKISKSGGNEINYGYDASGNRISKSVKTCTGQQCTTKTTYYVRDASGNVMGLYTKDATINNNSLTQTEVHLYGSSRLGILNKNIDMQAQQPGNTNGTTIFTTGNKFFELSNHLGNVLVTISDKKIGHDAGNGTIDYYTADVVTANDYYPGGMGMPGRKFSAGSPYRYGFNGKENDNEVKKEGNQQDYGMRIYDPRLERFLSVDPITNKYPELTPYQFASNSPIAMIDIDGLEGGWELSTPASNLRYHYEMQQKLPQKRTPQAATSSPTPVIQLVHSEAAPLALRQAKQMAMNQGLTLTPEQRKASSQAAIVRQMHRNQATISQGGYLGSEEYKIAKANYETYGKYLPGLSDFDDLASFANAVKDGKVDDAAIFAVAFVIPEVSGKMLKGPMHHVFTNKNFIRGQQWSKKFAPMFEKAGYKLNDAINKIEVIGHKGPHPEEYHQAVFDRLQSATKGLDGNDYKKAFENTLESLKKEVNTSGTELNKLLIKEK